MTQESAATDGLAATISPIRIDGLVPTLVDVHHRHALPLIALVTACHGPGQPPGGHGGHEGHEGSDTMPMGSSHGDSTTTAMDDSVDDTEGSTDADTTGTPVEERFDLPATVAINDGNFATSPVCSECHSNADGAVAMRDERGHPVGPDDLWQGSMMANSARDPFWWAVVRAETVATPSRAAEIEAECTKCHAPMASIREDLYGGPLALADLQDGTTERSQLALDGVSCTACHQVPAGEVLGPPPLNAGGPIYGPHENPFSMPMAMHTGFEPAQASHIDDSAMCGTCHTLHTEPLAPDGTALGGLFVEQSPYLEWRNSTFSTEAPVPTADAASCQACHMPTSSDAGVPLSTRIARRPSGGDFPPITDRSPFGRHVLVGGNTLVPAMLRDFADELRPRASAAALDATIAAARAMLQHRTAIVSIDGAMREGDTVVIPVLVENLAGHKLPTGIPARRAFVRVTVRDADGAVIFRSGQTDADGRLVDASGTVLPLEQLGGDPQPHHTVITEQTQVQIYEAVMQGNDGAPTYRLLRATTYAKDNRLLPLGWSAAGPHADETSPQLGGPDANFVGGSDRVEYRVLAPAGSGPYSVEAQLLYQPIGARFAAELLALEAPEIRAFERIWDASDRSPEPVAAASLQVP